MPSYDIDGNLMGKATMPLAGEYFSNTVGNVLTATDTISGNIRPWGLSARVPMYVVSPWSRGGWVNSQVFDHTSVGRFLEKRFGIKVAAISPWHRAISGDLTTAFDFASPNDPRFPDLPDQSNWSASDAHQQTLPAPTAPATPQPLFQETGVRFSRALPYILHARCACRCQQEQDQAAVCQHRLRGRRVPRLRQAPPRSHSQAVTPSRPAICWTTNGGRRRWQL